MLREELRKAAKENMTMCNACPVCNGRGCKGKMPGPGGRGNGENFMRSHDMLQNVFIHMDAFQDNNTPDTTFQAFSQTFRYPIFAAPIGLPAVNFGPMHTDGTYTQALLDGCMQGGAGAFTGDGPAPAIFDDTISLVKERGGFGIPTIKGWKDEERILSRFQEVRDAGACAVAMDIDCVGLVLGESPFCTRSIQQLKPIIAQAGLPFIIKGIMTPRAAEYALEAGAAGIVVSTHGGRVLADALAPIEVLPDIAARVKGKLTIFVDGAIRTGGDVFKALALGADAVLIGRPFTVAAYGGGAEGVKDYVQATGEGLRQTMRLTDAATLAAINAQHVKTNW